MTYKNETIIASLLALVFIVIFLIIIDNAEENCLQKSCPGELEPIYLNEAYECICGIKPR